MTATIAEQLRALRQRTRSQLTQTQAASLLGKRLRSWQNWEVGAPDIGPTDLELWLITAVVEREIPPDDPMAEAWIRPSILGAIRQAVAQAITKGEGG